MKKNYTSGISESVRIRHYVINLLYHAQNKPMRVPSSAHLARDFGVSRSTVLLALKKLREEGVIIGERGRGVFINPNCEIFHPHTQKLVGMLFGSGVHFCYQKDSWHALATAGEALTDAGYNIRLLNIDLNDSDQIVSALRNENLSALLMIDASSAAARIAACHVPTILIGHQRDYEDAASVRFSYENGLTRLRKELHFTRPVFIGEQHWLFANCFQPFWTGAAVAQSRSTNPFFPEMENFAAKVQALINKEKPDIIFVTQETAAALTEQLQELHLRIPLVCWKTLPRKSVYSGYCFSSPMKEACRLTVAMLAKVFAGEHLEPRPSVLEVPLINQREIPDL